MMNDLFDIALKNLKSIWGFDSFRDGQEEVVRSVLQGSDTLVLFPTGGGKSLCYQVPATVMEGLTVVISPLIALMQDQVNQLNRLGIDATFLNSTLSNREIEQRLINARNGMYKLLYCSPERLQSPAWQYEMNSLNIDLIAVDEAHCISEWGHDFRPAYRNIKESFEALEKDVRWMALTATATPEVRKDIVEALDFREPEIISRGFDRPNLKWWVIETRQKKRKLMTLVRRSDAKTGLVYAGTRKNSEEIADELRGAGFLAEAYHAGLKQDKRADIQNRWLSGELNWVVATSAFGMGIDKPDCRYVIHYLMPLSLEAYYQESGRAGRDGVISYPVLLYNQTDYKRAKQIITDAYPQKEELQKIYNAVCDSFQLAIGSEQEDAEQVVMEDLSKRSGLPVKKQQVGLQALQQIGILNIITNYEPQCGIRFTMSYDGLLAHVQAISNSQKRDFIDRLFRSYGPESLEQLVYLDLSHINKKLDVTKNQLIKGLEVLKKEQILQYDIRESNPLVKLNDARMERLPFSNIELMKYREVLLKKLEYMLGYARTESCRGAYLSHYFGEKNVHTHCGHCDLCEKREKGEQNILESKEVQSVLQLLEIKPGKFSFICSETGINTRKLKLILNLLMRENKVMTMTGEPDVFYLLRED